MRILIFNKLKEVTTDVFNIGKQKGEVIKETCILKFNNQIISINNSKSGYQRFEVMCYSPLNLSITKLDTLLDNVIKNVMGLPNIKFQGEITQEYVDQEKNAYMRSIYFYIPKEVK